MNAAVAGGWGPCSDGDTSGRSVGDHCRPVSLSDLFGGSFSLLSGSGSGSLFNFYHIYLYLFTRQVLSSAQLLIAHKAFFSANKQCLCKT